jgi:glucuronoarabinoxylan endo-1,4-beta-xylanase
MSLLRIGPDPAGENVNTAYQVSPDYDGFGWAQSIDYAKYALSCNPSLLIFATPYSAPNTMTSNGTFFAGSLLPADYSAYGSWLQSYNSYASSNGVPLYAISLQNEPDAPSTYIGYTTWSAAQFDSWFAGDNGSAITTKVMFPEGCCSGSTYADTTLEDSNAAAHVGVLAEHCYGGYIALDSHAFPYGVPQWVSECDPTNPAPQSGVAQTWGQAMEMAQTIAQWLNGGYNAYNEWWAFRDDALTWWSGGSVSFPSGNILPIGYAIGQYSKFVRPGYTNVSATYNPQSNVNVTAYTGSGNFVIVAINANSSAVNQSFALQGATISSFTPYVSTSSEGIAQQNAVSATTGAFSYNMPAQSIVTFVGSGSTGNLLTNPDFTGNLSGWTQQVFTGSSSEAYDETPGGWQGNASDLAMSNATGSFKVNDYQVISGLTSGTPFKASIYVTSYGASGGPVLAVQDGSPSWNNLCEITNIPATVSTWTQYTCSGTVDSTGTLQFVVSSNPEPAGAWIRWQFASLTLGDPNLLANPSWSTGNLSGWNVQYWTGNSSNVYAQANGVDSISSYNGNPYYLLTDGTSSNDPYNIEFSQQFTGQPAGHSFTATIYAYNMAGVSDTMAVQDQGNNWANLCTVTVPAGNGGWQPYTCTGKVPNDGDLQFSVAGTGLNWNEWTVWDSASLTVQ